MAAAEDQDVGHGLRACRTHVCRAGQTDRTNEFAQRVHLAASSGALRVERPAARDDGDQATGSSVVQRLDQEMVVEGVALALVEARIVQLHLPEGNVADREVEGVHGEARHSERLGADRCVLVQLGSDAS